MSSIRTIIVDDEFFNRALIRLFAERSGSGITVVGEAQSLEAAAAMVQALDPDLVLLDLRMPDGNGLDLLARFPQRRFEVLLISGFDEHTLSSLDQFGHEYVLKPIDEEVFAMRVAAIAARINSKRSAGS